MPGPTITSSSLPRELLNPQQIQALSTSGAKAVDAEAGQVNIKTKDIRSAYHALVNVLRQINDGATKIDPGVSHALMRQAQALIASKTLSVDQVRELRTQMQHATPTLSADPSFAEAPSGLAAAIVGDGRPTHHPMAIEAEITNSLLAHGVSDIESASASLAGPVGQSVVAYKDMQKAGLWKRIVEGLRKLFQGKNYKEYPIRELEKDLHAWMKANSATLGRLSAVSDLSDLGGSVMQLVTEAFPDAEEKWLDAADAAAQRVVTEHWNRASEAFAQESQAYLNQCNADISRILQDAGKIDLSQASPAEKLAAHLALQDKVSSYWASIDLGRLTASDVCEAMEKLVDAQRYIVSDKERYIGLVTQSKQESDKLLKNFEASVRVLGSTAPLKEGDLTKVATQIEEAMGTALKGTPLFALVPGSVESLATAASKAKTALHARCTMETETKQAQNWYREAHGVYSHTVEKLSTEKGKTKFKHLNEQLQKAPKVAIEADRILHAEEPAVAKLAWLYDTGRTLATSRDT